MGYNQLIWKEIEAKLVCLGIPTLGLTILLTHLPQINPLADLNILVFIIINIFAELLAVVLPGGISVSLSYPIMMCSLLLFGPVITMWVYLPSSVITQLMRKKEPFKMVFNISQIAVSIWGAGLLLPKNLEQIVLVRDFAWIFLIVFAFDLLNFCQVVKVISLQTGTKFFKNLKNAWLNEMATVKPIYYATGVIMAMCFQIQGLAGALLVIAPVLSAFFQLNTQSELKNQKDRANTDALTGLCNRHALNNWWPTHLSTIANTSKKLSVIMIDIDDFKKVNDNFGHEIGDIVLKTVASTLQECVRRTDCIFRFGGEEFVVLLPDSDLQGAKHVAERIRTSIGNTKIADIGNSSITISAGLSCLTARVLDEKEDVAAELIRRADNAMYVAKQNGKNQVQIYT